MRGDATNGVAMPQMVWRCHKWCGDAKRGEFVAFGGLRGIREVPQYTRIITHKLAFQRITAKSREYSGHPAVRRMPYCIRARRCVIWAADT